ncbi:MAG: hypothetical protein ACR2H0_01055 [Candidatus Limnocylindrales bacterium]
MAQVFTDVRYLEEGLALGFRRRGRVDEVGPLLAVEVVSRELIFAQGCAGAAAGFGA